MTGGWPSSWTDERKAEAKRRYLAGESCAQIAKALGEGLTRNAVIGVLHRMNVVSAERSAVGRASGLLQQKIDRAQAEPRVRAVAGAIYSGDPHDSPDTKRFKRIVANAKAAARGAACQPPPDKPAPKLRIVNVEASPKKLTELRRGQCRWPLDLSLRETTEHSLFCARKVRDEACSYCADHARIAFQKTQATISLTRSTDRRRFNGRHFRTGNASPRFAE